MKWRVIIVFMCLLANGFSQNLDSLELVADKETNDSIKAAMYIGIARSYTRVNLDEAERLIDKAEIVAEENGFLWAKGDAKARRAMVLKRKGEMKEAITLLEDAQQIYTELQDSIGMSIAYNNLGVVYEDLANFNKATELYLKSLAIDRALEDSAGIAMGTNNIGLLYAVMGEYDKGIVLLKESMAIKELQGNERGLAYSLLNIGNLYHHKNDFDSALYYYEESLILYEKFEHLEGQGKCWNNIGLIYTKKGDIHKAIECHEKSLSIRLEIGYALDIVKSRQSIAEAFVNMGEWDKAIFHLSLAEKGAEEIGAKDVLSNIYGTMRKYYEGVNDFRSAYEYAVNYSDLRDSMMSEENRRMISNLQTNYETEKYKREKIEAEEKQRIEAKERKVAELEKEKVQAENERMNMYLFAIGISLILVLLVVVVSIRAYLMKRRSNQLLEEKNAIIQQKNKDITDSIEYASQIQTAILPDEDELKKLFPNLALFFEPRDIVSGDFYWACEIGGRRYIAAADCTGHGVPGAFVSMLCCSILNHVVIEKGFVHPGEILTEVNRELAMDLKRKGNNIKSNDGMDVALCSFDTTSKKLEYAGAINPLILIRNEEIKEYSGDRKSIGGLMSDGYSFKNYTIDVEQGDTFYIFSDGFADQFGGKKGKKYMGKRFRELLKKCAEKNTNEQVEFLKTHLYEWQKDYQRLDDVLVVGVKF